MKKDERINFITEQFTQAICEANPTIPPTAEIIDSEAKAIIGLALNVFDRLLPMIVSAIIVEYKNQVSPDGN